MFALSPGSPHKIKARFVPEGLETAQEARGTWVRVQPQERLRKRDAHPTQQTLPRRELSWRPRQTRRKKYDSWFNLDHFVDKPIAKEL